MSTPDPERSERELEDLLRRVPPEQPDPARRAAARRAFLAGETAGTSAPSRTPVGARMGGVMAHAAADEEADGFVAWLAAHPPAVPPAAEFRRRARLAFLSEVAAAATPPLRARRSFRRTVWALAAAAILAVTFLLPTPERWSVQLDGRLAFEGTEYLPGDETRLAAALEGPGTVETAQAPGYFTLGGELVLELLAGSALTFPSLPELDGITPLEFQLAHGEAYLRTGAAYPGNPIVVRTAQGDVALHGTTVGVLVDESGTCVCVADGKARVTSPRLSVGFQDVGPRSTLLLFADPGVDVKAVPFPESDAPEAAHTADLVQFQFRP